MSIRGKKCSFFGKFGVLCFLVTSVLKFPLLPYYQRNNGYARFKIFPGANSKELLHYIVPTLENGFYNTAVVHVRVNNDLLQKNSLASVENLLSNLISARNKRQASGIEKIFISTIALSRGISPATIESVNEKIPLYKRNSFIYADNTNILNSHLFSDGLHLIETGKCLLASNFINTVKSFCTRIHKYCKYFFINEHTSEQKTQIGCSLNVGLQLLHDLIWKQ